MHIAEFVNDYERLLNCLPTIAVNDAAKLAMENGLSDDGLFNALVSVRGRVQHLSKDQTGQAVIAAMRKAWLQEHPKQKNQAAP